MSTIGLAIDDLDVMLDQTLSELDGWINHMKQSGMSSQRIKALVTKDLAEGGRIFGQFKRGIKTQVSGAINSAQSEMNIKTMMKKGANKAKWVVRSPNPCPDCSPRHGRIETMAYWKQIGVPVSGFSVCRGFCRCVLVDVDAKIPDHPITDPIKKKKPKLSKKDSDFRQRSDATIHWDRMKGSLGNKAIHGYTMTGQRKALQVRTDAIQKSLNNAPDFVGKTHKRVGFVEKDRWIEFTDQYKQGNIINQKSFMSTTYDKSIIKDFGDELYKIEMEVESKTGSIIESISVNPSNKEVLFKYDSIFEVTKLDIVDNLATIKMKEL